MMQRNETILLDAWLRYHGHLFGFENLTVCDDGSDDPSTAILLDRAERAGADIHRAVRTPSSPDRPWRTLLRTLQASGHRYDMALPLTCGEFLVAYTDDGLSCRRGRIEHELGGMRGSGMMLRLAPGLSGTGPGEFSVMPVTFGIVPSAVAASIGPSADMALPPSEDWRQTTLACLRFDAGDVLGDGPRVIFQGLGKVLEALGVHDTRLGSPVATPRGGADDAVWIRTATGARPVRFKASAYRRAHPDVAASDWKPFHHFLAKGISEGRAAG